jgi:hypothetical protein
MSSTPFSPARRHVLAASVAAGAMGLSPGSGVRRTGDSKIRPFKVNVMRARRGWPAGLLACWQFEFIAAGAQRVSC